MARALEPPRLQTPTWELWPHPCCPLGSVPCSSRNRHRCLEGVKRAERRWTRPPASCPAHAGRTKTGSLVHNLLVLISPAAAGVLQARAASLQPRAVTALRPRLEATTLALPSALHHPLCKWRHDAIFTYESTAKQIAVALLLKGGVNDDRRSWAHLLFLNVQLLTREH